MITNRIGRHEVLLPINQNYDKIWEGTGHWLSVSLKKNWFNSAKCATAARAHDAYCPLAQA